MTISNNEDRVPDKIQHFVTETLRKLSQQRMSETNPQLKYETLKSLTEEKQGKRPSPFTLHQKSSLTW